jgi:hypothetical protein
MLQRERAGSSPEGKTTVTTMSIEDAAKLAAEVADMVARIMRQLAEMTIEQKLGVPFELDRWISMEQGKHHERQ